MKKAILMIDMQDTFLDNFSDKENKSKLIENIIEIVKKAKSKNIPIIDLNYDIVGLDLKKTNQKLAKNYSPECVFIKENNSAFTETKLHEFLQSKEISELILLGVNANGCVQDTAISAINRGYNVTSAKELIASVWRNDLELSKNNLAWYKNNTNFLDSKKELLNYLKK